MKKIIAAILMSIVMLSGVCGLYASAYESNTYVTSRLNNTILTNVTFEVNANGVSNVGISYVGYTGITKRATITTVIEKYSSGTWTRVNIGTANNQWVDNSTLVTYSTSHSVQLTSSGKYRAVVTFVISGLGGVDDVIEKIVEKNY